MPLWLSLLACASPQRAPRDTPLAFAAPEQHTSTPGDPELDAALARVAKARGLEFLRRPTLTRVPRSELVQHALRWLEAHTPDPTRRAEAALLGALELVPAGFDWDAALGAALEARLSAFYDHRRGQIWLDRALPSALRRRVLAHELVHVLADQHHALGERLAAASSSADARAALLAIAEGDAEVLVQELEAAGLVAPDGGSAGERGSELPTVIERSLAAAYVDGHALVRRVFDAGGWPAVDALYAAPPPSTHALLAPGSPIAAAGPTRARRAAARPPGDGWSLVADEAFGERTWRVILEEWTGQAAAFAIARGWRYDRLSYFERERQRALLWEVHAEAESAVSAHEVLRAGLRLAAPSSTSRRASAAACRAHRDGGVVGLWRRGQRLWIGAWSDVPARDGCRSLSGWMQRLDGAEGRATDPGPHRLIGPA